MAQVDAVGVFSLQKCLTRVIPTVYYTVVQSVGQVKMGKQKERSLPKLPRRWWTQYQRTKGRIQSVGFIWRGTLQKRRLPCGNPNCGCHSDPKKLHGPYHQLTWKERGKTVSWFIPDKIGPVFRKWIENRRRLQEIMSQMQAISRKAGEEMRDAEKLKSKPVKQTTKRRKPRRNAS